MEQIKMSFSDQLLRKDGPNRSERVTLLIALLQHSPSPSLSLLQVSWIRRRDLHILTVGTYTYTTDQRFEVVHAAASRDWILKLRYAQERDSGLYDCQVSRRPVLTYSVRLSVYGECVCVCVCVCHSTGSSS